MHFLKTVQFCCWCNLRYLSTGNVNQQLAGAVDDGSQFSCIDTRQRSQQEQSSPLTDSLVTTNLIKRAPRRLPPSQSDFPSSAGHRSGYRLSLGYSLGFGYKLDMTSRSHLSKPWCTCSMTWPSITNIDEYSVHAQHIQDGQLWDAGLFQIHSFYSQP